MSKIKLILCAIILAWYNHAEAFDPSKDLKGSTVVAHGYCIDDSIPWECFALSKDDKKYIVMTDEKGAGLVYEVKDFKPNYKPEEMVRVWQRIDA